MRVDDAGSIGHYPNICTFGDTTPGDIDVGESCTHSETYGWSIKRLMNIRSEQIDQTVPSIW
jgi:hypothetical protein